MQYNVIRLGQFVDQILLLILLDFLVLSASHRVPKLNYYRVYIYHSSANVNGLYTTQKSFASPIFLPKFVSTISF